jgi:hypothetical protein
MQSAPQTPRRNLHCAPALFQADNQSIITDSEDKSSVYRSFGCSSDLLVITMKVPMEDIKIVNRWAKKEAAATSKLSMEIMTQYYAEIHIMLPYFMC